MKKLRKTKIICTIGPASDSEQTMRELMLAGMNVARLNFSHGTHEEQKGRLEQIKRLREELKLPVASLLDTRGPEIRICELEGGRAELQKGQSFILTAKDILGNSSMVSITYKELVKDVKAGDAILIDDGLIGLEVKQVTETDIICTVKNSGAISNRKGINVPGVDLNMPFISQKDYDDILFGIQEGVDFIAASFTRSAEDIYNLRKVLEEHNGTSIRIIAKIENMQGINNIDEIIHASDGIMVARGDLGVEVPLEEVPIIQKRLIKKAYSEGKPVITATQMLDSMMKNPRPTRAEATDVANAIYQGTSAIMLSGETAAGQYPVEAVKTMVRLAMRTEADINYDNRFRRSTIMENPDVTNAISHATCTTASDLHAAAIITVTKSGGTAAQLSKYRPGCPIIACAIEEQVCRQMNLSWGIEPLLLKEESNMDVLFDRAVEAAERAGYVKQGELTVLTAGVPLGVSGTTNLIKVQLVGHVLVTGQGITNRKSCASLCVCQTAEELKKCYRKGNIVVVPETDNEMMTCLKTASAIIVEKSGLNSHAAIVGLSLDIPVILGAENATKILKNGAVVVVNAELGTVSVGC